MLEATERRNHQAASSLISEQQALESARKEAKEAEAFWYARIQAIDARIDEIEAEQIRVRGY